MEAINRDQMEAPLDVNSDNDKAKPGKHSLMSATFVQIHNAIGAGILLFPYAFWAFGGPVEAVAAQLVSYYCTTTIYGHQFLVVSHFIQAIGYIIDEPIGEKITTMECRFLGHSKSRN